MSARVAIVTRTLNRPQFLARALASVVGQSFKDWHLVIVNDGGRAEAVETAVAELGDELKGRVTVLHHETSQGMQKASNAGIAAVDSEFIVIHDDDDTWTPAFLEDTVAYLDAKGPDALAQGVVTQVTAVTERVEATGEISEVKREAYLPAPAVSLYRLGINNPFPPIAFVFRRAAYAEVGSFDERFGPAGDMEFNFRFLRRFEIGLIPQPLAHYHLRESADGAEANSALAHAEVHAQRFLRVQNELLRSGPDGAALAIAHHVEFAIGKVQEAIDTAHAAHDDALAALGKIAGQDEAHAAHGDALQASLRKLDALHQQMTGLGDGLSGKLVADRAALIEQVAEARTSLIESMGQIQTSLNEQVGQLHNKLTGHDEAHAAHEGSLQESLRKHNALHEQLADVRATLNDKADAAAFHDLRKALAEEIQEVCKSLAEEIERTGKELVERIGAARTANAQVLEVVQEHQVGEAQLDAERHRETLVTIERLDTTLQHQLAKATARMESFETSLRELAEAWRAQVAEERERAASEAKRLSALEAQVDALAHERVLLQIGPLKLVWTSHSAKQSLANEDHAEPTGQDPDAPATPRRDDAARNS